MNRPILHYFEEPNLLFRYDQGLPDPRDGLILFGPLDEGKPHGIRLGVVGTSDGIRRAKSYLKRIQKPIFAQAAHRNRPVFPGFEAAFGIPCNPEPYLVAEIAKHEIEACARLDDRYHRVFDTVTLYEQAIIKTQREGDVQVDLWLVVVPDIIFQNCRPRSVVFSSQRQETSNAIGYKEAQRRKIEPVFSFAQDEGDEVPYQYDPDFHNQLKGRLLCSKILTQVLRESTIAFRDFTRENGSFRRDLSILESEIAWNISSASFYKAGGRPWKLRSVRPGVCYIGIVFKQVLGDLIAENACCAAQMFLDSGDGVVFKGDVGPWYNPKKGDYHLSKSAAKDVVEVALNSYRHSHDNKAPSELFIHARTEFNDAEWEGFTEAAGPNTSVVAVRIKTEPDIRVYHPSDNPVLRGNAWILSETSGLLFTGGWVPRLQTYPGREVPRPLRVDVFRGNCDITTVMRDVLSLTKLNYNSCRYADGLPVTLRFADNVGEILSSGPKIPEAPLQFRHYI
jgi:hypothetical protein